MVFLILRNGENISLNIPTQSIMENNQMVGKIGIGPMIDQDFVDKNTIYINHDFLESIKLSIYKTFRDKFRQQKRTEINIWKYLCSFSK